MTKKSLLTIGLLLVLSLPAVWPILLPGYFPMHDDTQVARVQQMYQALQEGQFPVRWVADLGYGYGYPIFNFYNPLPYYFGATMMFLGLDALAATKLMFIFPIIMSSMAMFVFARLVLPRWGSLVASMLYLYAPYHAAQIYVRGAVAEYWAFALLPLVFWALWKRRLILGGVILASLILSHNLSAFMSVPFLILLTFLIPPAPRLKSKAFLTLMAQFVLALGLSAFFWLPATLEASKTRVAEMVFGEFDQPGMHVVRLRQLWWSPWGFGGSSAGIDDGFSMQLGKIHLLGAAAAIVTLGHEFIAKRKVNPLAIFCVVGLLFSLFMMMQPSTIIWNSLPLLSYIQFPWRFLTFASLFSSILTACAIWRVITIISSRAIPVIVFCFLVIVFSLKFFQPQFMYPATAGELITRDNLIWEISRRSDEYLPRGFIRPTTLQEARRVDNPQNAMLVSRLIANSPVRSTGNFITLITLITLITPRALKSVKVLLSKI